jgi:hypothetical protein
MNSLKKARLALKKKAIGTSDAEAVNLSALPLHPNRFWRFRFQQKVGVFGSASASRSASSSAFLFVNWFCNL